MSGKPRPRVHPVSAPFWQAAREHRLIAPRCEDCGLVFLQPRAVCPGCLGSHLGWAELSGRGRVYTCTVVRQPAHPAFLDDVPYVYAVVELEEGCRLATNVVGCEPTDVVPDMAVQVVWDDVDDELTLPRFVPVASPA